MSTGERVRAWRPDVPGVDEVLHAHFTEHAYPAHTHDHWTLLLVDTGGVEYDLEHHHHQAAPGSLTVLPPHVPHDGRAAIADGFDKRVVYVDERWLSDDLVGAAVRRPALRDDALTREMARLHDTLISPGDELEAESRLAFLTERITQHLDHSAEVAAAVGFYDQAHLTRHFRRVLGVTPGAYVRHAA